MCSSMAWAQIQSSERIHCVPSCQPALVIAGSPLWQHGLKSAVDGGGSGKQDGGGGGGVAEVATGFAGPRAG